MAQTEKQEKIIGYIKKVGIYIVSLLGAAGNGLQNYMAVAALMKELMSVTFALTKGGMAIIQSIAIAFGGLCSSLVNLCINIGLLESFLERITKKKKPNLKGWQRFRYWFGSGIFIVTGVLFGLTTFAFGPVGALAAVSIAAGIFVSVIMMIQELETWLESFDTTDEKKIIKTNFYRKVVGLVIAIGNVVALSLLFTMGLASFLIGFGVPALPALIVGLSVAFTGGAFTEFYFYNRFLSDFCNNISEKWKAFKATKFPILGMTCGIINALVNGVLSYVGIMMISSLIVAAGIACPPLGAMIAVAAVAATFAALASFVLGLDFWINNSKKLTGYFSKGKSENSDLHGNEIANTKSIFSKLSQGMKDLFSKNKKEDEVPLIEKSMIDMEVVSNNTLPQFSVFKAPLVNLQVNTQVNTIEEEIDYKNCVGL